jgi:NAD(P) transhydrogenase
LTTASTPRRFDVVVFGSGPAGQKAALQARAAGRSVALIEEQAGVGGSCVHFGTIPSKTLRETALHLASFRERSGNVVDVALGEDTQVASLMARLEQVVSGHVEVTRRQLERAGIALFHGRGSFVSPTTAEVLSVGGSRERFEANVFVIATGSRPRTPPEIPVDHEHVLDSDSILSMIYLPRSLVVLGAGVIASEYASIFAALGVQATMVDRGPRPMPFLDPELTERFVGHFEGRGGRYLGGARVRSVAWDGVSSVVTRLEDGTELESDKLLCALGRVANLEHLNVGAAGLTANARGVLEVDEHCRTAVPHIYAVGDVIGPPALASAALEQGRRAMCHAFSLEAGQRAETIPMGVYTIPEMSTVGLSEEEARRKDPNVLVGRARFEEVARGLINGAHEGLLKLVADARGEQLLGAQIIGEGATEIIHVAQMALLANARIEVFVENIFNFPTLAEAYRTAALDIWEQRRART